MAIKKSSLIIIGAALVITMSIISIGLLMGADEDAPRRDTQQSAQEDSLVQTGSSEYQTFMALTGDEFDERYLADMIVHHQGAVEMADLALQKAEREDIKQLSREIIQAQAKEITDMERWQQEWGYADESAHQHMSHGSGEHAGHGAMSMADHMEMMLQPLREKTGAAFDAEWITQMIVHHQGAVDMSAPAAHNAKHQEIKDLAQVIIIEQTREIEQMKGWQ